MQMTTSKICNDCKKDLPLNSFGKRSAVKSGLSGICKSCASIRSKNYRLKNIEKVSIKNKESCRKYYKENRKKVLEKQRLDRKNNPNKYKNKNKENYKRNSEKIRNRRKSYYGENTEKELTRNKKYAKLNKAKCNAIKVRYYTSKLNATPNWSELEKIEVLYEKCKWLESLTGLKYHVDHIVPLQGKNVCGLHVWENLQILEDSLNCSKRNKFNEDADDDI